MEYKKFGNLYAIRIYKEEDLVEQLRKLASSENIKAGAITGIGAAKLIETGIYDIKAKKYNTTIYEGMYEITNLTGNISVKDEEPYIHMHINFSDADNRVFGGHLLKCVIAVTSEIFVTVLDGEIKRKLDEDFGGFMMDLK